MKYAGPKTKPDNADRGLNLNQFYDWNLAEQGYEMKRIFAGLLVVMTMMLFGCGGGSSGTTIDTSVKKAAVTGAVSFPALGSLVAKQVAATVIPPVLTITDLSGAIVATPTLTVDPLDPKKYTYAISLDVSKNYILKASWGGQVLRGLADQNTLNSSTTVVNITPVSTAAVLVAEKMLNLTAGQLGTTAAGSVTSAQLTALNPAALLSAVENGKSTTYASLVTEVTAALTNMKDPVAVTAVTTAVTDAPAYVAPLSFTAAMISGKSFNYSDNAGNTGIVTFNANGTFTNPGGTGTWSINAAGQLVAVETDETSTVTLTGNTGTVITASIVSSTAGAFTATFTAVTATNITVADYAKPVGYLRYNAYPGISHTHYFDGVQSVNGKSVNVLREVDDVGSVLKETIYFSSDVTSGVYFLGANGTFFVNPYPVILPSFVPGQEYGPYDIFGNGSAMVYITWTFEDVTVPYGTFTNALKQKTRYKEGTSESTWFNWHAKDVGGVKWQDGLNVNDNELLVSRSFTAAPKVTSIIGTWGGYGVDATIITFVDSTHYMLTDSGGLEYGTYTYDPATGVGAFALSPLFDTNGEAGASHPPAGTSYSISVTGDTLTVGNAVEGNRQLPRLKSSTTNPVVGSWWAPFADVATGKAGGVLIAFLDDTHCLLAQAGNDHIDTTGVSGIELGTYVINSSKVLSTSLVVDTNGEWGFSNPPVGSINSISVSGNDLTISNTLEGNFVIARVQ